MAGVTDISIPCESTASTGSAVVTSAAAASPASAAPTTSAAQTTTTSPTHDSKSVPIPPQPPSTPPPQPKYVCVILHRKADDHLLLESRGADAVNAASKLTCFGGKIEHSETPLQAILRECDEEMGWTPPSSALSRCVDFYVDNKLVAYFYLASAPPAESRLKFEEVRMLACWCDPCE